MDQIRYDLDLFEELNEQYSRNNPALEHASAIKEKDTNPLEDTTKRISYVDRFLQFKKGMRVLEIGCGRGHLSSLLKLDYGCDVVGVDIRTYPEWEEFQSEGLDLRIHDISAMNNEAIGTFDRIIALAVWEHMEHPYAGLTAVKDLLKPAGQGLAYISANLYRGPKASHRYREVLFPWPHLLFEDQVFTQFYRRQGRNNVRPAWVNKLTVAHYEMYLKQLDFEVVRQWTTGTPIDEEFYQRFIDKLGRYPRYDLEQDFVHMVLGRKQLPQARHHSRLSSSYLRWRLRTLGDLFRGDRS